MVFKLKLVEARGYETYKSKVSGKQYQEESKETAGAREAKENEKDVPVPLVTHVNNILPSVASTFQVYVNNQHIYNAIGLYAHNSYFSNNFKGVIFEYKKVLHCEGYGREDDSVEITDATVPEAFFSKGYEIDQ